MVRSTSGPRPISGSTLPSSALRLRLTVNWSSAVSFLPFLAGLFLAVDLRVLGALRRLGFDLLAALADAVADKAHCIQAAHIVLLEEINGIAVAFGKQCDQHIGAGNRVLAGRLHMQDRALDHALETGGRLRVGIVFGLERLVFLLEILLHHGAELGQLDAAGGHHLRGILVVDQRQKEVLQRGIFMPALGRVGECLVERFLEIWGETGHSGSFVWIGRRGVRLLES